MDLTRELEAARNACRTGGAILLEWAEKFTAKEKSPSNLVTEADLASQRAIHDELTAAFPDYCFLGEEETGQEQNAAVETDRPRWVVDPLDGTGNYVHGFPYYAVSIGLEVAGRQVVGAIFDPTRDEMFSAVDGQGAWLNRQGRGEQKIEPTDTEKLSDAFCVASLPVDATGEGIAVRRFLEVIPHAQTVQRTGSAALNLCYTACGRMDAFWSTSLKPWDMAAGVVIVREAGGRISACDLGPFDLFVQDVLATNGTALHESLSERLMKTTV